jgi:hypothetical protein
MPKRGAAPGRGMARGLVTRDMVRGLASLIIFLTNLLIGFSSRCPPARCGHERDHEHDHERGHEQRQQRPQPPHWRGQRNHLGDSDCPSSPAASEGAIARDTSINIVAADRAARGRYG